MLKNLCETEYLRCKTWFYICQSLQMMFCAVLPKIRLDFSEFKFRKLHTFVCFLRSFVKNIQNFVCNLRNPMIDCSAWRNGPPPPEKLGRTRIRGNQRLWKFGVSISKIEFFRSNSLLESESTDHWRAYVRMIQIDSWKLFFSFHPDRKNCTFHRLFPEKGFSSRK